MVDRTNTDAAVNPVPTFDLGAWIGRGQALSFVANHCSAAQTECLTRIRKEGLYKALNLTWDEFFKQHAGASRAHADEIIRRLEEFGAAYFRISEIIRISPQSYRAMQAAQARYSLGITQLQARLDACFDDMSSLSRRPLDVGEQAALQGLIRYTSNKLKRLIRAR